MQQYLLDTDILIFWTKGNNQRIINRIAEVGRTNIHCAAISQAELYFGAYNSTRVDHNLSLLNRLFLHLNVIDFDARAAAKFGEIKALLKRQGNIIMDADLMIAAIALSGNLVLVTNNSQHFNRVPALKIENWS